MTDAERDELLIELRVKLENMAEDVGDLKHVLIEGNGKPPLTEQVLTNKLKIERLEEERADKKMPRAAWIAIVLSSLLSVAGLIAAVA